MAKTTQMNEKFEPLFNYFSRFEAVLTVSKRLFLVSFLLNSVVIHFYATQVVYKPIYGGK